MCSVLAASLWAPASSAQQQTYVKAPVAGESDRFGSALALSGSTLAVGAWGESGSDRGVGGDVYLDDAPGAGAVYLFEHDGVRWAFDTYIKATNTEPDDQFGSTLALDGDTLVVSTRYEDSWSVGVNGSQANNFALSSGAAYVYVREGGTWKAQAYLKASNTEANDGFGFSVAVSGDLIAVGAWAEESAAGSDGTNNDTPDSGAVYVFSRTDGTWTQEAFLKASNADEDDFFGRNLALEGTTLVVSSSNEASAGTGVDADPLDNSAPDAGAVYVFERVAGTWMQQAYLKASNTEPGDEFGSALALSPDADTLAVGAADEAGAGAGVGADQASNAAPRSGAVYVFVRENGAWLQQAYIKAPVPDTSDAFGSNLALSGDRLLVAAPGEDSAATVVDGSQTNNARPNSGAAYLLTRTNGVWAHTSYLKAHAADAGDALGSWRGVALSDEWALLGAPPEAGGIGGPSIFPKDNSAEGAGAVFSHDLVDIAWTTRGSALPGLRGDPQLLGAGTLAASSANSLQLSNTAPLKPAAFFLALSSNPVPFKGGVLKSFPILQSLMTTTSAQGLVEVEFWLPADVAPGIELWFQAAVADPVAPVGVALSNAVLGRTP